MREKRRRTGRFVRETGKEGKWTEKSVRKGKKCLTPEGCFRRFALRDGAVAQLGERLNGIQEVVGSIPSSSTRMNARGYREIGDPFFVWKKHRRQHYPLATSVLETHRYFFNNSMSEDV